MSFGLYWKTDKYAAEMDIYTPARRERRTYARAEKSQGLLPHHKFASVDEINALGQSVEGRRGMDIALDGHARDTVNGDERLVSTG